MYQKVAKSNNQMSCRGAWSDSGEDEEEKTKDETFVFKAYIILNKQTIKVEESLNVTFDETPLPPKTSLLEDDDLVEEEAIEDRLTSGDKSLDLSAFKLSRLFFSLLSLGSSSCWRSYGAQ
ncbi:hypothetical protein Tco_1362811 [Tanacetum coccineum]